MPQIHSTERRLAPREQCLHAHAECAARQVMVPLQDLLTERFLARCTRFSSMESFLAAGGLSPFNLLGLDPQAARRWDHFVRIASDYPDWSTMLREAGSEWMIRRLGIFIDG